MLKTDPILLNGWHVVANVEDCQPGKIVTARLLGEDLVLWRSNEPQAPLLIWQDYGSIPKLQKAKILNCKFTIQVGTTKL